MTTQLAIKTSQREEELKSNLRKMKQTASGLLVLFAAIFVVSSMFAEQYVWVGFVQATAEAAMVGAIADWFAVTALFRRPLGLKIPHTAIIPTHKDRLGQSLGLFVRENFLSGEIISEKLRAVHPSRLIATWISKLENSQLLANYVTVGLNAGVEVMNDKDIQELIQHSLSNQIRTMRISPVLGNLLFLLASGKRRQELVRGIVNLATRILEDNGEALKAKIALETPWWLPKNVDETIYQKVIVASEETLTEIKNNPNHPFYDKFDEVLAEFIEDLRNSPEVLLKEEAIKEDLLQDPMIQDFSASLWLDIKASLAAYESTSGVNMAEPIQQGIMRFGHALLEDEAMLVKLDYWIEEAAAYIIEEYGHEVEYLIANTIQKWDADETSRKIELQVGKDLQFIRINGTLVGGLVGFVIHAISLLLGGG